MDEETKKRLNEVENRTDQISLENRELDIRLTKLEDKKNG